ncbi:hypothetical protein SAMN05443377_10797 [Propionibacterium cyclohexanicum]|uniref:TIGR01777 family protein n=1 Tax=Propionibacterium cyclohexanicum TaxID=64702 RepID=A0A1H9RIK4_9ACTN|nr:TIGR01777 family oxidoreductase [Propionibacterium cyclohexanicum]SER72447.1 hypothetical protein SAMN05443377_10797 [Propionibacterium cyclohexanicum]
MRVVVSGATGLIGGALVPALQRSGHEVVRLVRHEPRHDGERQWAPGCEPLAPSVIADADAVVNLSGSPIARLPWTSSRRAEILGSRIDTTASLVAALRQLARDGSGPRTLINASAVGYYGDRPGVVLYESESMGAGFLAKVARRWEETANAAPESVRVVTIRTGIVLAPQGTAAILRFMTALGVAGPLGTGRQIWPWISLRDEVGAIVHLLGSQLRGPVNLAAPARSSSAELGRELARQMRRPYRLTVPRPLLAAALGDAARELLLADQHVVPDRLLQDGYRFHDVTLHDSIAQTHR